MVCSLTRTAAAEVAGRDLPIPSSSVGTLHSQAYRRLIGTTIGIADAPKFLEEWNMANPSLALTGADRDLDEDNGAPQEGKMPGDSAYQGMNILRARLIAEENWPVTIRSFYRRWCSFKTEADLIDFTDMLEIALETLDTAPGDPDVIFADEAQDFSALEMALLSKWGQAAGRLVIVGDPWQALYEWRGSDPQVFSQDKTSDYRVLSQSYRVPWAVYSTAIDWIQKMPGYEQIDYMPTDEDGEVGSIEASFKDPLRMLPVIEKALEKEQSVMILASCAYMLSPIIKMLREEGIPFHNSYRTKNGAWNPLLRRKDGSVSSSDRLSSFLQMGESGFWSRDDLKVWLSGANCSKILPSVESWRKFEPKLSSITTDEIPYGLASTLVGEAAIDASMAGDFEWYKEHLASTRRNGAVFPCQIAKKYGSEGLKQEPRVTIGTIHSVKGGEADVVILAPDLSQQGIASWGSGQEGKASIYRLMYVALTRTKSELHIMRPVTSSMAVRLLA